MQSTELGLAEHTVKCLKLSLKNEQDWPSKPGTTPNKESFNKHQNVFKRID